MIWMTFRVLVYNIYEMITTDIAFICFIVVEVSIFVLHIKFIYDRPLLDFLCVIVMLWVFIGFMYLVRTFNL